MLKLEISVDNTFELKEQYRMIQLESLCIDI